MAMRVGRGNGLPRAGEMLYAVKSDGFFPRYQGRMCDGTSLSGGIFRNLGGTAEV